MDSDTDSARVCPSCNQQAAWALIFRRASDLFLLGQALHLTYFSVVRRKAPFTPNPPIVKLDDLFHFTNSHPYEAILGAIDGLKEASQPGLGDPGAARRNKKMPFFGGAFSRPKG